MEDKKTKRSDKRWKTVPRNGKRFTKFGRKLCKKDSLEFEIRFRRDTKNFR